MGLGAPQRMGLPGPGIEPVSLALQGGFLTTGPPGKPRAFLLNLYFKMCLKYVCKLSHFDFPYSY